MSRLLKSFTLAMFVFLFSSCLSSKMQFPLKLEKASCQTWDAGTKHRGNKVEVVLIGETEDVKIKKLIFRKKSTVPKIKKIDGKLLLTANFEYGTENKIDDSSFTGEMDMIVYIYKGKVYELLLKDIQGKSMKYYPKK